jgi:hypothetical protein
MLWHTVVLDTKAATPEQRQRLKRSVEALSGVEQILWLRHGNEPESVSIGFLSIFADIESLNAYRAHPLHLALVDEIRSSGVTVHRLNFEGPMPPG